MTLDNGAGLETKTGQPIINERVNPFERQLVDQGFNFDIPKRILGNEKLPEGTKRDRLTNLLIEDDALRTVVGRRLSRAIRDGENWAVVYGDADNLKLANNRYNRRMGDMVIRYGAAAVTQAVDLTNFGDQVEIIAARPGVTADETMIWIFGLSDNELQTLLKNLEDTGKPTESQNPQFRFSVSATAVSSKDPRIQDKLRTTKEHLTQAHDRISYDFLSDVVDIAEIDVRNIKIIKDLERLPVGELLTDHVLLRNFISILKEDLGNSRISDQLLETICKLVSVQTVKALGKSPTTKGNFTLLLQDLGINEQQLKNARTPEDLMRLFESMFGKET